MAELDVSNGAALDTPVLLLVFNRPDTTKRVFEAIAAARPRRLYVAADGPRADRPGEAERCAAVRAIATAVDWPCEVRTLFQEENLGCKRAVCAALNWFFDAEAEGIVLEDDCLPAPDFFPYCGALLARYREEPLVMAISGSSFHPHRLDPPDSYYFSRYNHCWGWASWRRAWALNDARMAGWPAFRDAGRLAAWSGGDADFERYFTPIFDRVAAGEIDSWAYAWLYSAWEHGGLACLPAQNLVRNIGFGQDGTHTRKADGLASERSVGHLAFPLRHPPVIERNVEADRFTDHSVYNVSRKRRSKEKILGSLTLRRIFEEFKAGARRLVPSRRE